ncbi:7716_t:CDS:2, partial [Gigaspora rosea]
MIVSVNLPTQRVDFTATFLHNSFILYIGGFSVVGTIYMSEIPIYNTNNDSWSTTIATGDTLYFRSCHTAVLSSDGHIGHIVIYGGGSPSGPTINQDQNLVILDTTVSPYQ